MKESDFSRQPQAELRVKYRALYRRYSDPSPYNAKRQDALDAFARTFAEKFIHEIKPGRSASTS